MATVNSVDEILEFAIAREDEANQLYKYMAEHMTNPEIREVCEDLAEEELEHKGKLELELMKMGKVVFEFNISDYVTEAGEPMDMSYEDLLLFAIRKEDKAVSFYRDLAKIIPNKESREVLLALVEEETEHRHRFEVEYDKLLKEI